MNKVNESLTGLLLKIGGENQKDFIILSLKWREIVGDYIAENSRIQKLEDKVAFISVNNSIFLQEMILLRADIKERIKKKLGVELKDIVFYVLYEKKKYTDSPFNFVGRFTKSQK